MISARHLITCGLLLVFLVLAKSPPGLNAQRPGARGRNDQIVNAFILYDIGRLRGAEAQRAVQSFNQLTGEQAIPALVRGVNKTARMRQSCPIIVVAGKLQGLLRSTSNRGILKNAIRDLNSAGPGVFYESYVERLRELAEKKLYGDKKVVQELRGGTASQLARAKKPVDQWTYDDLKDAIYQERDSQLVRVLEQLMLRKGAEHTKALAEAISGVPEETKELARGLLAQRLARMTDRTLIAKLEDPELEVRAAAVRAIGYKGSPLYKELAAALRDEPLVAEHARQALVKLSGEDLGPPEGAGAMDWYRASKRWEKWADQQPSAKAETAP